MTMPRAPASDWMRSPELSRETSARSAAFLRSSVLVVSTARPMPALSFSIETCMKTMPDQRDGDDGDPHAAADQAVHEPATGDVDGGVGDAVAIAAPPATTRSGGRARRGAGAAGAGARRG